MNLVQYLAALNVALAAAGSVDYSQCNGRSALWMNPALCTDTDAKCTDSQILPPPNYELFDVAWDHNDDVQNIAAGSVDYSQCNGRSALWINPVLCTDNDAKCTDSQILPPPNYEMFDVAWKHDEEVNSMLTKFMTLASITRDLEMQQEGQELCGASDDTAMPWDIQTCDGDLEEKSLLTKFLTWASITRDMEMQKEGQDLCAASGDVTLPWDFQTCDGDLKLVHRTDPILGHGDYNFEPQGRKPAMSTKEVPTNAKSGFGLPREKGSSSPSSMAPSVGRSRINLSQTMGMNGKRIAVDAMEV